MAKRKGGENRQRVSLNSGRKFESTKIFPTRVFSAKKGGEKKEERESAGSRRREGKGPIGHQKRAAPFGRGRGRGVGNDNFRVGRRREGGISRNWLGPKRRGVAAFREKKGGEKGRRTKLGWGGGNPPRGRMGKGEEENHLNTPLRQGEGEKKMPIQNCMNERKGQRLSLDPLWP